MTWLRFYGKEVAMLGFEPKQLISEFACGFLTIPPLLPHSSWFQTLVRSDRAGSGSRV